MVTMADALMRWWFNAPIEGYEEVSQLIFAVIIATAFPAGLLQGQNITIRFLGQGLGRRSGQWLEVLGAIATLIFFALIAWQITVFAVKETVSGHYTQTLELPTAPLWWVVASVMVSCIPVQAAVTVVRTRRALTGSSDDDDNSEAPAFLSDVAMDGRDGKTSG